MKRRRYRQPCVPSHEIAVLVYSPTCRSVLEVDHRHPDTDPALASTNEWNSGFQYFSKTTKVQRKKNRPQSHDSLK